MILGASFDTPEENLAFAVAQQFPFRLLSDVDRTVGKQYEVARPADDSHADYPMRVAYLIDPSGVIKRVYDVKDVSAHASEVLADLQSEISGA